MNRLRISILPFTLLLILASCGTKPAPETSEPATATDSAVAKPATDGPQVVRTQDGGRMEGVLQGGVREGAWVSYFSNGGIRSKVNYVAGVEQGATEVFHDNGMTYYTGQYRNGKTVGEWVVFEPSGAEIKRAVYDSLGTRVK